LDPLGNSAVKMKFTDSAIRKLPRPSNGRKDYWRFDSETQGWGVRVSTASKIFYYQERDGRGQLRERIGPFPALTTAEARKIVKTLAGKVAAGVDLRVEKAAKKAKLVQTRADDSFTLGDLISAWEEEAHRSKRRLRYIKATAGGARNTFARLLDRPAASITPEQLEGVWKSLTKLPAAAHAAGARARTLYRWALKTRRLENDPTQRTLLVEKPGKRQNFLTGEEARVVWRAAGTLPAPYGQLIKLLLASATRLRETAEALWTEFSRDLAEWTISRERMKINEAHVVWLPRAVREMLAELPRFSSTDFVFTSDGRRAVTGFSDLKKRLDKALEGSGVKPFRLHDFRRSVTTWLVRGGTDPIVADRLLAHTGLARISSVASTYNVYQYEAERRAALERWVGFLVGEEVEMSSNQSSQLALPPPEPTTPTPPEVGPPPAFQLTGMAEREALGEENFISVLLRIGGRRDVHNANREIFKREANAFAAKFLGTLDSESDPHETAIAVLTHAAALAHLEGITVFKPHEVEEKRAEWTEQAQRWAVTAKKERAEAEQARAMGQAGFAAEADARAEKAAAIAGLFEAALQNEMKPDDVCVVAYRKGDPRLKETRGRGVFLMLLLLTETIFGAPAAGVASVYATAATGVEMSRWRARQAVRDEKVGPPKRRTQSKCARWLKSQRCQRESPTTPCGRS
jgi:integrase